jgi:hypothetical protein
MLLMNAVVSADPRYAFDHSFIIMCVPIVLVFAEKNCQVAPSGLCDAFRPFLLLNFMILRQRLAQCE